jgi:hypothetical protein
MTGHCLCGAVTYRCDADALLTLICHCEHCQRQSGAAFSTNVAVPKDALQIEGDTVATWVTHGGESDAERKRIFCSRCGSPIATVTADIPIAVIKAGTLDDEDKASVRPVVEIWGDSAQPWVAEVEGRDRHPANLPR